MVAMLLLLLGAMLSRVGAICAGIGQRWLGASATRAWARALDYFRGAASGEQQAARAWERRFIRVGSSIVLCVIGALVALWTFLLIGGALAWLAVHGYGFYLLLGTVTLGVALGVALARQEPRSAQQDHLN